MLRERGFGGVGVADLMEQAGLTHGGVCSHFALKEALIAKAAAKGFGDIAVRYAGHDAAAVIDGYVPAPNWTPVRKAARQRR